MMQVSELSGHLLLCHEEDRSSVGINNIPHKNVKKCNSVHILRLIPDKEDIEEYFATTNNRNIHRYLDRFYLYTPDDKPDRRQQVLDVFFEMISEEYDSLVDVERNCDNVRNLIGFLIEHIAIDEASTVMDYGCGTGLSLKALPNSELKIIGIDRCPKMRKIAVVRGLKVWSPDELALQPADFFAGAFASYVLHLRPHALELELMWARLRSNAIFVANFHKNQGIELSNVLMCELGATIKVLEPPAGSEMHGDYVAYFKK